MAYLEAVEIGGKHVSATDERNGSGPVKGPVPGTAAPAEAAGAPVDADEADLFDWEAIRKWSVLAWNAPRHHPRLAAGTFLGCFLLALMAAAWLPRTYQTQCRIMTSQNLVMPALGNPGRAIPFSADAPTRGAAETILRRENLEALVKQTGLVKRWQDSRPALFRFKDWVLSKLAGPVDEETRLDTLVYMLEQRLKVTAVDGVITIAIDWPDAQMAYQLVSSAQQNFLETRHALEVSTIAEAISILEGHAAEVKARVEEDGQALRAARGQRRPGPVYAPSPAPASVLRPVQEPSSAELANLKLMLLAKRRALADLEGFRQRRLGELQAQLAELKSTYTAAHPIVQATRESMEGLSRESPQLAQLRREEQELVAQVLALGGRDTGDDSAAQGAPAFAREFRLPAAQPNDDDRADALRMRLNYAIQKYESLIDRIESARIEQDTARAAFKYRYTVVRPAEVSKKPAKPNIPLTVVAGLLLGVMLAVGTSARIDWKDGLLGAPEKWIPRPPEPLPWRHWWQALRSRWPAGWSLAWPFPRPAAAAPGTPASPPVASEPASPAGPAAARQVIAAVAPSVEAAAEPVRLEPATTQPARISEPSSPEQVPITAIVKVESPASAMAAGDGPLC